MIFCGYFLAILMGATLGLIGAGGSILTVPILVYFFKISPLTATSYSLLVVGITALSGGAIYYRQKLIDFKAALIFAIPSSIAVFTTRSYIIPKLPAQIFFLTQENFIMLCFAFLMLLAAFFMLNPLKTKVQKNKFLKVFLLIFGSTAIGLLTGFVGAGGGFLIVPTLLLLFNLEMKNAIATSLIIIATNSLIGFKSDIFGGVNIDWKILAIFISLTIFGMFLGINFNKKINSEKLRKIFAAFIILISLAIFTDLILKI
jgi:uncharacterized membrane protein YfcA